MRETWDQYYMGIATKAATRATCDRKHVGAVLVRSNCILSTGFNGSVSKASHCDDVGHLMEDGHCVATVHAELNAVIQAAKVGSSTDGATLYCTAYPCWSCFKAIAGAGVKRIVYYEAYRPDAKVEAHARVCGVQLECLVPSC